MMSKIVRRSLTVLMLAGLLGGTSGCECAEAKPKPRSGPGRDCDASGDKGSRKTRKPDPDTTARLTCSKLTGDLVAKAIGFGYPKNADLVVEFRISGTAIYSKKVNRKANSRGSWSTPDQIWTRAPEGEYYLTVDVYRGAKRIGGARDDCKF